MTTPRELTQLTPRELAVKLQAQEMISKKLASRLEKFHGHLSGAAGRMYLVEGYIEIGCLNLAKEELNKGIREIEEVIRKEE
jgi:hypothetical protein